MTTFRHIAAMIIAPIIKQTGFRFSKAYRYGDTFAHRKVR